jgi:two-component system CheB/CheR fusion protein
MVLSPNRVFLMPPRKEMTVHRGAFDLAELRPGRGWPSTISLLLFSLAEAYANRTAAIILSGMGNDGSAALKAVKVAGGVTFAQSNPEFGSMPRHAAETHYIDFVLSAVDIANALLNIANRAHLASESAFTREKLQERLAAKVQQAMEELALATPDTRPQAKARLGSALAHFDALILQGKLPPNRF